MSFFSELRRRNVFRVATAYAVVGWLIIQVGDVAADNLGFPDWFMPMLFVLLGLGFPLALFLAWAFEMTPDGVQKTADTDRAAAGAADAPRGPFRGLNLLIVLGLVAIIAVLAVERVWFARSIEAPPQAAAQDESPEQPSVADLPFDKSIAVLPFSDFSPDGDSRWFADGLSEEILNALVRVPDLLVAARTSSFSFRDSGLPIPEIAAALGVAHVLEGSVRMSDDRIRVTAQLIRASDGFHIWSNNFDRETADMIGIQEDLARQISTAMETTMDPEALAAMAAAGTRSVEAYTTFIRGRAAGWWASTEAYVLFEEARELDPGFAAAHYRAALYWRHQANNAVMFRTNLELRPAEIRQRLDERIDAAIRTADDPTDATLYRAIQAQNQLRLSEALRLFERYVTERPGDLEGWSQVADLAQSIGDSALHSRAIAFMLERASTEGVAARRYIHHAHKVPDPEAGVDQAVALLTRLPNQPGMMYQVHRGLLWVGRSDEARKYHDRIMNNHAGGVNPLLLQLRQACAEGRVDDALLLVAEAPSDLDASNRWLIANLLSRPGEADAILKRVEAEDGAHGLVDFLSYPQFDASRYPSLVDVLERDGIEIREPRPTPFACPPQESTG